MKANGINHLWAKLMISELTRCGITEFCISPGSRSTPLALAVADDPDASAHVHFDERGSAFRALGLAKATGKPAVLICTSGTAVANYYPAIIEASQSTTPMIVLSADRPMELRCTGALQTIDQVKMFGSYLRWSVDLLPPDLHVSPEFLLTTIAQAVRMSSGSPAGPVHLNCQYREPLAPLEKSHDYSDYCAVLSNRLGDSRPYTDQLSPSRVDDAQSNLLVELAKQARRGVIVAGALPAHMDPTSIVALAELWQWPLLADVCSGTRSLGRHSETVICHADLYLRNEAICEELKPDFILQFGAVSISKSIVKYSVKAAEHYVVVNDRPDRIDPDHSVTLRLEASPEKLAIRLQEGTAIPQSELLEKFTRFDSIAAEFLPKILTSSGSPISELQIAFDIARITPSKRGLFLATSMPIREFDCVATQSDQRLHITANRGANGIDGTIASAVGFADGLGLPVTLLIGDVAALHDLNSLALLKRVRHPLTIVILNNDGGGIFSMLPIGEIKSHFEEFFATPHGLGFLNAAEMFNIKYHCPNSIKDFGAVYRHSLKSKRSSIIEIKCNRMENAQQHRQLWKSIQERVVKYAF